MMRLYRTSRGILLEEGSVFYPLAGVDWDEIVNHRRPQRFVRDLVRDKPPLSKEFVVPDAEYLPPLQGQEVWGAGVTYFRSRDARIEESRSGGGSFYDLVYRSPRPELFFKGTLHRVAGHLGRIAVRRDSRWTVPEPELALVVSSGARIVGYTIGNDVSARDIEGENPLYLPQAKVFSRSCALGPSVLLREEPLPSDTAIRLEIRREGAAVFEGQTSLAEMKRAPEELVDYLFSEDSFPRGCVLLTGTGIVPPSSFYLKSGDEVRIQIDSLGTLVNFVS